MTVHAREQDQIRAAWDAIATDFDRVATPLTLALAEEALRRAQLRPGETLLDVAAGSGALAVPAARLGARVLATDLSSGMIERLRERARREGLDHLDARVMDGYRLDLANDAFDVAASQNGVSLFPDVRRGLSELTRVTKPGGRVLIVAFGAPAKAEFLTFFLGALTRAVPGFTGPPMDPPPLPFRFADPDTLRRELEHAGLRNVSVATDAWRIEIESAEHLWELATSSNPIGAMLVADLAEERKAAALRELQGMLDERAGDGGPAVLCTDVNVGIGRKAATPR